MVWLSLTFHLAFTWKKFEPTTFLFLCRLLTFSYSHHHWQKHFTWKWKSPQVSNLTLKSTGSLASPGSTDLRQFGSCEWPLTYMRPWKLASRMLTVTSTPSAKQLTTMSGRGKSVLTIGGGGMGTVEGKNRFLYKSREDAFRSFIAFWHIRSQAELIPFTTKVKRSKVQWTLKIEGRSWTIEGPRTGLRKILY